MVFIVLSKANKPQPTNDMIKYIISIQGNQLHYITMTRDEEKSGGGQRVLSLWHDEVKKAHVNDTVVVKRTRGGSTTTHEMNGCLINSILSK